MTKPKTPIKSNIKCLQITETVYIVTEQDDTIKNYIRKDVFFSLTTKDQNAIQNLKPEKIFLFGLELDPETLTFTNL